MLSPRPALGLLSFLAFVIFGLTWVFARRQNRKTFQMGGKLSVPKQIWLGLAIYTFFLVAPVLSLLDLSPSLKKMLWVISALWWGRGLIELVMLYVTKNWRPPYGILHNATMIVVSAGTLWTMWHDPSAPAFVRSFVGVLLFATVLELIYAVVFHALVHGKTTGEDGIWFANQDDPRFRKINAVTAVGNGLVAGGNLWVWLQLAGF